MQPDKKCVITAKNYVSTLRLAARHSSVTHCNWGCTDQLRSALRRCVVQRYWRYEGTGVQFPEKKGYVKLDWPLRGQHCGLISRDDLILLGHDDPQAQVLHDVHL